MIGLYIHVPFCQSRCAYCSFYSTTRGKAERDVYVEAVVLEMKSRATTTPIATIYVGGGTPSQLDVVQIKRIFAAVRATFVIAEDAEITFECNPDDVTRELASALVEVGVNRVSMGAQSFDDGILKTINRRHTTSQVFTAIDILRASGISNISIDLIYGLPGQTLDNFRKDVSRVVELVRSKSVTHVSSYALSIEEGTPLYIMRAKGEIADTDEDISLAMYEHLVDMLTSAGMEHYEISNFALPGFHSRHNSSYWSGTPYIGVGPAAHSYDGRATRRWNVSNLKEYVENPAESYEEEHLTPSELYDELIMTRLRTSKGLNLALMTDAEQSYLSRQASKYIKKQLLEYDPQTLALRLTRQGIFVSDAIFSDLMWPS